MEEIKKRNWSNSKFGPPVRLTKESHQWLKAKAGKKSMAGFLEEIISYYKKHGDAKLREVSREQLGDSNQEGIARGRVEGEVGGSPM